MDRKKIAMRYLRSDLLSFWLSIMQLPSSLIVIWSVILTVRNLRAQDNNNALALIVLIQYIPRFYLIFPLSQQIIKTNGVVTKTAWAGAVYNLLLYMIASHVLGASWSLLSVERQRTCWKSQCTLARPLRKLRFLIVVCQANRNVKAGLASQRFSKILVKKYFYRYAVYLSPAPMAKL
ncbi:unnamed protein product [Musa hybrid cultivar]